MKNFVLVVLFLNFLFLSCQNESKQLIENNTNNSDTINSLNEPIAQIIEESSNYLLDRDLDEDGIPDNISFEFTEGAHCCYYMSLKLSSMEERINYPFDMDGGYMFGVDGSWPDHFEINDFNCDGFDEIFMEIATYNGVKNPIPSEWTTKYGITTNTIIFDFIDGKLVVLDFKGPKYGRFLCSNKN